MFCISNNRKIWIFYSYWFLSYIFNLINSLYKISLFYSFFYFLWFVLALYILRIFIIYHIYVYVLTWTSFPFYSFSTSVISFVSSQQKNSQQQYNSIKTFFSFIICICYILFKNCTLGHEVDIIYYLLQTVLSLLYFIHPQFIFWMGW